jgi:membrane fusion protein, multidrug efflux system
LNEQSKVIAADEANAQGDRGTLNFAEQQLTRFTALARTGAGTVESLQQAQSDLTERQAALQRDVSTLAAASGQVEVLRSQTEQAKGMSPRRRRRCAKRSSICRTRRSMRHR